MEIVIMTNIKAPFADRRFFITRFILSLFFYLKNLVVMDSETRKCLHAVLMLHALMSFNLKRKIHPKVERLEKYLREKENHLQIKYGNFYFVLPYQDVGTFESEYTDIFSCDPYYSQKSLFERCFSFFWRHFFGEGAYEVENVRVLKEDIVIDAGAHIGIFSLLALNQGAGKVYAFEPNQRIYEHCLKRSIELNHGEDIIIPIPYGVGAKKEQVSFADHALYSVISHVTNTNNFTVSSDDIITVNITTLDDFVRENNVPHVDFIKADIEGAERLMLEGARDTIKRFHPRLVICTYHLPDDKEVLTKIIKNIDASYKIVYTSHKLFAW
jgi:FkbM family methyltransferase